MFQQSWFVCSPFTSGSMCAVKLLLWSGRGKKLLQYACLSCAVVYLVTSRYEWWASEVPSKPNSKNEVVWSSSLLEAGLVRWGCSGPCLGELWVSPETEIPQPLWHLCQCLTVFMMIKFFFYLIGISPVVTRVCYLLSCLQVPSRRACLHDLYTSPLDSCRQQESFS